MKTSCIYTPPNSRFIQLNETHLAFCQGNHCAAFLLSFFSSWHDWKIRNDQYYCRANDIAEVHGDGRPNNENAYLFFTTEDLVNGLMGLFGKKAISDGLELLVNLKVITIHKNPNPRYHFDKTKYFRFYPEIVNNWLEAGDAISLDSNSCAQVIDNFDNAKIDDAFAKNARPSIENGQPSRQNRQAITDTTNNTTKNNKSINKSKRASDFLSDFAGSEQQAAALNESAQAVEFEQPTAHFTKQTQNQHKLNTKEKQTAAATGELQQTVSPVTQTIIDSLIEKGMSKNKFYADSITAITRLHEAGATTKQFIEGYDIALQTTKGSGFGVNYLIKVVESLLLKAKQYSGNGDRQSTAKTHSSKLVPEPTERIYENDFKNAMSWAADLL